MTAARVTQQVAEVAREGNPNARATQVYAESGIEGNPKARVTQQYIDVAVQPGAAKARMVVV
jgi:hypothetical protein